MELSLNGSAISDSVPRPSSGDKAHKPPGKVRSACDRCHTQKLRCIRDRQQASCKRCIRLKTLCRFSPRAPRVSVKSPEQATTYVLDGRHEPLSVAAYTSSTNVLPSSVTGDVDASDWMFPPGANLDAVEEVSMNSSLCYPMQGHPAVMQDISWPGSLFDMSNLDSPDLDGYINPDLLSLTHEIKSRVGSVPSPEIPSSQNTRRRDSMEDSETAPQSIVQKLATLNVALDECAAKLPSRKKGDPNSAGSAGNAKHGSRQSSIFAVDELFRLSNVFMEVLKCLSSLAYDTSFSADTMLPNAESAPPLVSFDQQFPHRDLAIFRTGIEEPSRPFSHVDEATMFMVISCHGRLVEIYSSIFQMMQACLEYSLAPQLGNDWTIILPKLQVGSLASPPLQVDAKSPHSTSTSSIYGLVITMLSSQLWDQLASLLRMGGDVPAGSARAPRWVLTDTIWETVLARTDGLTQSIANTKVLLQRHSDVMG